MTSKVSQKPTYVGTAHLELKKALLANGIARWSPDLNRVTGNAHDEVRIGNAAFDEIYPQPKPRPGSLNLGDRDGPGSDDRKFVQDSRKLIKGFMNGTKRIYYGQNATYL
eukprot:TRINITY_DN24774_c0_g1_i1.p1 TRINITY_DN24774_c0_g1~~TRINITY_DN24774_c0_g1_i1.p1  ORF type:complete len:117 (-),score=5.30 TRINITY_DN24774_c0_g1_i1:61-390(-)